MIYIPKRNLIRPSRFKQRGTIGHFQCMSMLPGGGVELPTTISDSVSGAGPQSAGFIFRSDGTIDAYNDGSATQIGVWHTNAPRTGIGSNFDVRFTSAIGSFDFEASSEDAWIDMSSDRTYRVARTVMEGIGTDSITCTFEVGNTGSASALDSTSADASAENTS